tara:strand:+ start:55249 stop:55839 length:591 start_codon:yes stop_codon:yes gene_type:complete
MDRMYNWMSSLYDGFMVVFPLWKKWISSVLPEIKGTEILEVSFGPGYLMSRYGTNPDLQIHGIDFNSRMVDRATKKMQRIKRPVELRKGNVESLPYRDESFDTVINTMALTGYPDAEKAMDEMLRVLRPGGRLLIVDFDYPANRNRGGYILVRIMAGLGDIIRDLKSLLHRKDLHVTSRSVGGFGSVQLFVCDKIR